MDNKELREVINEFCEEHGDEEAAKLLSQALLELGFAGGGSHYQFAGDIGRVIVHCESIPDHVKH